MPVDEADWITVPEHDLREVTDEALGPTITSTAIRRDWLYSVARSTTGLWLTRLLSDYAPAGLTEGQLVICRTARPEDLAEGQLCLWRVATTVVIGRFSVRPDVAMTEGALAPFVDQRLASGTLAAYLDPALGITSAELTVPPSRVGPSGPYHLVGRILGVMIRPI